VRVVKFEARSSGMKSAFCFEKGSESIHNHKKEYERLLLQFITFLTVNLLFQTAQRKIFFKKHCFQVAKKE